VLGICYGLQLMTHGLGGTVEHLSVREDGQFTVSVSAESDLFHGAILRWRPAHCVAALSPPSADIPREFLALLTHGDSVTQARCCPGRAARR
jgi:GMP synthase-like glutamine amidotransferase